MRPPRFRGFRPSWSSLVVAGLLAGLLVAPLASPAPSRSAAPCDRYAAPSGDDEAAGTAERPLRTAQRLVDSLAPGETGCLAGGRYVEDLTLRQGGAPGAPITLRSAPDGGQATLLGRFWIADSANDVVVEGLILDGRNSDRLPSPTINGDRVTFRGNDVTNAHTEICFIVGSVGRWGVAVDTVIERNRIHDCGVLPAANHDHGIYLESSRNARIVGNLIYDNADRGIQLYPDAQDTLIQGNILDGNGQGIIFSGSDGRASNGNRVIGNVISNSKLRYNVESWYPEGNPVGRDNVARKNCLWNGRQGNVSEEWGFEAADNVESDPLYADRDSKDFRLDPNSPCADVLGRWGQLAGADAAKTGGLDERVSRRDAIATARRARAEQLP